jgi:hypothetical protein
MTPCHWDAVDGPFSRFTPPIGHGAPRTRTVPVAPVGVRLAPGAEFSPRMSKWTEVQWGVVQSMHVSLAQRVSAFLCWPDSAFPAAWGG